MKLNRSRMTFALIALLLVGGGSAAFAVLTTPQPARVALADVRKGNPAPTATATATAPVEIATATSATSSAAPTATTPPAPQPTNTPFTLVPGQSVDLKGTGVERECECGNLYADDAQRQRDRRSQQYDAS